jgi:CubicO group peptidase (beta-lactamase class C family)
MGSFFAMSGASALGASASGFLGVWFGTLDLGSRQLRLKLEIGEGPKATLYSLDQGGSPIPAGDTRIDGDRILITWPVIGARYEGQLTGGTIVGTFMQGGALPLTFTRAQATSSQAEPLTQAGLAKLRADSGAPAFAAAALNRGGRRIAFVDGRRAVNRGEAVTLGDKWHIGSCTKSMTATLVARAVESGAIGWNDTVGQVLGSAISGMHPEFRDVTYRHLLSHRSGLGANIDPAALVNFPRESADARGDRVAYARAVLTRAPAGRKEAHFEYSNAGYVVAGAMLETRLGAPWEQLLHDRVFAPLAMTGAGIGAPGTPGANDQPVGHAANIAGALEPYPPGAPVTDNPAVIGPAGRVHATLDDLIKYLSAHCFRSPFLKPESWQMLHTPPFGGSYALGWDRRGDAIWHNGSNTLWYCEMIADPKRGIVAVAAANDGRIGNMSTPVGKVLNGAAAAVA